MDGDVAIVASSSIDPDTGRPKQRRQSTDRPRHPLRALRPLAGPSRLLACNPRASSPSSSPTVPDHSRALQAQRWRERSGCRPGPHRSPPCDWPHKPPGIDRRIPKPTRPASPNRAKSAIRGAAPTGHQGATACPLTPRRAGRRTGPAPRPRKPPNTRSGPAASPRKSPRGGEQGSVDQIAPAHEVGDPGHGSPAGPPPGRSPHHWCTTFWSRTRPPCSGGIERR